MSIIREMIESLFTQPVGERHFPHSMLEATRGALPEHMRGRKSTKKNKTVKKRKTSTIRFRVE